MAQPMTGRESAPLARSNRGISIFAEEKKSMTSRTPKTAAAATETPVTLAAETVAETPATVEPTPVADLATLVAQRKALDEQIKAAKVAAPKLSKLDSVIARQLANPTKWIAPGLASRVDARVKAGQPLTEAVDAVLAQYRAILLSVTITTEAE